MLDYHQLDRIRARTLIERLGDWLLIDGEVLKGIFSYPTVEQILSIEGQALQGKSMRQLMRQPYLWLHRNDGSYEIGAEVHVLCKSHPSFEMAEFLPSDGALYRVELREQQSDPMDTIGRKWR